MNELNIELQLLKIKDVSSLIKLKPCTIRKMVKNNSFPFPIKIDSKSWAWRYSQIRDWINNLPTV